VDLNEANRCNLVTSPDCISSRSKRRDERADDDVAAKTIEQECNLASSPHCFIAFGFTEAEIAVEPSTQDVAI
jgi:hypothetical protein